MTGRTVRWRLAALAVGCAVAIGTIGAMELWCRRQEGVSGLVLPFDQPGRKYALAATDEASALNALGFNDGEVQVRRRAGVTRVVVLGDSVTFGSGVRQEQVYPAVAEAMLLAAGRSVEILNFAVFGYDVEQVAATLHHVAWSYRPDLVVYAWFSNDDFPTDLIRLRDGAQVFVGTEVPAEVRFGGDFALPLARCSAGFRRLLGAQVARGRTVAGRHDPAFFARWLDAMAGDARAHGTPLVVYGLVPHVLANADAETCGAPVRPPRFCARELEDLHAAWAAAWARQLPFVSVLPWLRSGGRDAYWTTDPPGDELHPNAEGHALFARGLADLVGRWMDGEDLLVEPAPGAARAGRRRGDRPRREFTVAPAGSTPSPPGTSTAPGPRTNRAPD